MYQNNKTVNRAISTSNRDLRIHSFPSGNYTVIDNGTDRGWVGGGWTPILNRNTTITDAHGSNYPIIDACSTLIDPITDQPIAIVRLNQVVWKKNSKESLLPPDQMSWNGLSCDMRPLYFGGAQQIIGNNFKIDLWWDGKTTFLCHRKPTIDEVKSMPQWVLTGSADYNPHALTHHVLSHAPDRSISTSGVSSVATGPLLHEYQKDLKPFSEYEDSTITRRVNLRDPTFGHSWKTHQLAEWRERLGFVSEEVVKKTFLATTQLVPSVKHENEDNPKDFHVSRFPFLKSKLLRETWYIDPVEVNLGPKAKREYALVCYGDKSKACFYFILGTAQTAEGVLACLWEFTRDIGSPDTIKSDYATNLVQNNAYKRFMRLTLIKLEASEADRHNQNHVERKWQDLKRHAETIILRRNVPMDQSHRVYQHLCDCFNHTATSSINWRTPWEMIDGDTPDISVFRFKFWEPIWYLVNTKKFPDQRFLRGRFVGIAWTTGDSMCYRIYTDESNIISREIHRSIVVPRHPDETYPRTLLKLNSDYFFPTPKWENSEAQTNAQPEGGRKRERTTSTNVHQAEHQQRGKTIVPGSSIIAGEPVSQQQTTHGPEEARIRKEWLEMTLDETNRIAELYSPPSEDVDHSELKGIVKHMTKSVKGEKIVHFYAQYHTGQIMEGTFQDMKEDAPYMTAMYIIQKKIPNKECKDWATAYIATLDKVLSRTRLVGDVQGERQRLQRNVNSAIVSSRRSAELTTPAKRKGKPGRNNRQRNSPLSEIKYGIKVPKNVAQALSIDQTNGNKLWQEAIKKEIDALMEMKTFKILSDQEAKCFDRGQYQYAPLRMIFDVKHDLRRKARLVLGGHVIDASGHDTYASNMKGISARVLMLIAQANDLDVLVGDIGNAYLYATTKEKIYCRTGQEFESSGQAKAGQIAVLVMALYGTKSAANRWHAHLADTLRSMKFIASRFDRDIWYRLRGDGNGYDYIGTHTDDLMVVAKQPQVIFDKLLEIYTIKKIEAPSFHLGCDYVLDGSGKWLIGTTSYIKEALEKVKLLLGKKDLGKDDTPMSPTAQPELDTSPILDVDKHRVYQQLVGIAQWLITCGRFDLCYAVSSLSRYSSAPREMHLKMMERLFKYINKNKSLNVIIDAKPYNPPVIQLLGMEEDWEEIYPGAIEELDDKFPTPMGKELSTTIYFDADHAHDQKTRKSITGIIAYIGNTPVIWMSKRQGAIATSTYGAELCAARTATEEAISIRYMLRSLGVPITKPTLMLGDNLGSLQSVTSPGAICKKKHTQINFHYVREAVAAGIVQLAKVDTKLNLSDSFTKPVEKSIFLSHRQLHYSLE
jgi:Reverse transcriptase (RNA-dependent DNA polymerase)